MFTTFRTPPKRPRQISPIEDAIADIKAGKMVILMDDEQRENEGDLCMAARRSTPAAINFMAKYGRGLICLALTEERIQELGLAMMVSDNRAPLGTAFTVSIDARHGITHGVSAHDRSLTIQAVMKPGSGPQDIVTPGHIFPLRARRGGVLVRTGQTEGGVDLSRLAGLPPASVICEIMNEDGSMARLADLERFAARHDLKICTIADLIQYRLRCDSLVHRVAEATLPTRGGGDFKAYVYRSDVDDGEHLVLVRGEITPDEPILVRAHAEYLPGDVFGSTDRDTVGAAAPLDADDRQGRARRHPLPAPRGRRAIELVDRTRAARDRRRPSTDSANRAMDFREYGIGAQILRDVGLGKIRLITNYPRRMVSLPGYGLEIVELRADQARGPQAAADAEAAHGRHRRRPRSLEERGQALQLEAVERAAAEAVGRGGAVDAAGDAEEHRPVAVGDLRPAAHLVEVVVEARAGGAGDLEQAAHAPGVGGMGAEIGRGHGDVVGEQVVLAGAVGAVESGIAEQRDAEVEVTGPVAEALRAEQLDEEVGLVGAELDPWRWRSAA